MRVMIIGSCGNIGSRYAAIVRYLGHEVVPYDIKLKLPGLPQEYDCCIIATPISDHTGYLKKMILDGTPVLCEKPISNRIEDVQNIVRVICQLQGPAETRTRTVHAFMVNNWAFVGGECRPPMSEGRIVINTYNTGPDGDWDLIQPLYLVEDIDNFELCKKHPGLYVEISGHVYGRDDFDESYVDMVKCFLDRDYGNLWPVEYILEAHDRVRRYSQKEFYDE